MRSPCLICGQCPTLASDLGSSEVQLRSSCDMATFHSLFPHNRFMDPKCGHDPIGFWIRGFGSGTPRRSCQRSHECKANPIYTAIRAFWDAQTPLGHESFWHRPSYDESRFPSLALLHVPWVDHANNNLHKALHLDPAVKSMPELRLDAYHGNNKKDDPYEPFANMYFSESDMIRIPHLNYTDWIELWSALSRLANYGLTSMDLFEGASLKLEIIRYELECLSRYSFVQSKRHRPVLKHACTEAIIGSQTI